MKYTQNSNAWAFTDAKSAALYFEKAHLIAPAWVGDDSEIESLLEATKSAVDPLVTIASKHLFILGNAAVDAQDAMLRKWFEIQGKPIPSLEGLKSLDSWARLLVSRVWTIHLAVATGISGPGSFLIPRAAFHDDPNGDPSLLLAGLSLVDTTAMSWEQLLAIREDENARRKLRRLRLFLYEEHVDKDPSFVRDDLAQRIDDYNAAAKEWGAEVKEGILTAIFDKDVALSSAATMAAAVLGQPSLALAAAIPAIAKFGKVAVELRRRRRDMRTGLGTDPVSFLCEFPRNAL